LKTIHTKLDKENKEDPELSTASLRLDKVSYALTRVKEALDEQES
jgi:hypothetical protein